MEVLGQGYGVPERPCKSQQEGQEERARYKDYIMKKKEYKENLSRLSEPFFENFG